MNWRFGVPYHIWVIQKYIAADNLYFNNEWNLCNKLFLSWDCKVWFIKYQVYFKYTHLHLTVVGLILRRDMNSSIVTHCETVADFQLGNLSFSLAPRSPSFLSSLAHSSNPTVSTSSTRSVDRLSAVSSSFPLYKLVPVAI